MARNGLCWEIIIGVGECELGPGTGVTRRDRRSRSKSSTFVFWGMSANEGNRGELKVDKSGAQQEVLKDQREDN